MPDDHVPDFMKTLWKGLNQDVAHISPDELRIESEKLNQALRKRSLLASLVALLAAAMVAFILILPHHHPEHALRPIERIGMTLLALCCAYAAVRSLRGRPQPLARDIGQTACLRFYRASLERERDYHRGWRLRVLAPQFALLVLLVGSARAHPESAAIVGLIFAASLLHSVASVRRSLRAARMFQNRIDALDASLRSEAR
jgi:hypothetical protein